MPKVKLPRKSTAVDMTAMCDVAFLLLSFFILATKTKPPEAVTVVTPSSISTRIAKDDAILITLNKEGKVYLMLGDRAKKQAILEDINTTKALGLTPEEMTKLRKMEFYGMPFNKMKSMLQLETPSGLVTILNLKISFLLNASLTNLKVGYFAALSPFTSKFRLSILSPEYDLTTLPTQSDNSLFRLSPTGIPSICFGSMGVSSCNMLFILLNGIP